MDPDNKSRFPNESHYDRAGVFSRFWLSFILPLFVKGARNDGLNAEDLPRCPRDDEVERLMKKLEQNWRDDCQRTRTPSFAWTMFRTNIRSALPPILALLFIECVVYVVQPLMLGLVIRHFNGDASVTNRMAWLSIAGISICQLIIMVINQPILRILEHLGMRHRVAICGLVYKKSLRLSRSAMSQTDVGQIVNLLSNDVNRFDDFVLAGAYLLIAPIQSIIILYVVWGYLSWSCLVAVGALLLFIPFQGLMGKLVSKVQLATATLTDSRLRYMSEIISGIRTIKMYCWERPFAQRVAQARKLEMAQVRRGYFYRAINLSIFLAASRFILFGCLAVYVLFGNVLDAEGVFVCMALFNILRLNMTLVFSNGITMGFEVLVVCKRVEQFLLLEEIDSNDESVEQKRMDERAHLVVDRISARWTSDQPRPTLMDISADLKSGDLLAVIGPVGAGKSSFLMSLLKELPLDAGQITIEGTVSYSSQDAWSFNESVRNNILFGAEYDEQRYQQVVDVCALRRDFSQMPLGDGTLVGENGAQLSGGQKARINLARAVYRDADILLLDDPLSAVDSTVAEYIFNRCIMAYLRAKIRVLVTHQLQFIEKANKILVLAEGQCLAYGSIEEIQQAGIDFVSLLVKKEEEETKKPRTRMRTMSGARSQSELLPFESQHSLAELEYNEEQPIEIAEEEEEEEQTQHDAIQVRTIYWKYLRDNAGICLISTMLVFTFLSQAIFNSSTIFLTYWTDKNQNAISTPTVSEQNWDILIYSTLIVAYFLSTIVRSVSIFAICLRTSVRLHNQILSRLLRAPIAFFDSNPAGRILNRFARDLGTIDEQLPYVAFDLNVCFSGIFGIIVTVSWVNWYLILPAIPLSVISYFVIRVYLISSRDIRRYEGITRSPMYSHVSATINGLASVRAFGAQRMFEQQFYRRQNDHTAMWFLYISSSRTLGIVTEVICFIYILIITCAVMFTKDIDGGRVGLAISTGLMIPRMTQWGMRQYAEFQNLLTSFERVMEYQELEQEAPTESSPRMRPFADWPQQGQIAFHGLCLTYGGQDGQPVLKNITCRIRGGEKVGVIGRTGAGKSSIIGALFRLTEPSSGTILIDGLDILSIGLDNLRKRISIIPQDPTVFTGTVRTNLDPFDEYPDADLWAALEEVQLRPLVDNYTEKLDAQLSDSGSNLSVGQRQLLCLARAILRKNRILILDEATANVDQQTDSLIQGTIRTEFAACTVLTIAHRLNTIIDCDRVMVLDAGEIVEFDSPWQLLQKRGAFFRMCQMTGQTMFEQLRRMAQKKGHEMSQY